MHRVLIGTVWVAASCVLALVDALDIGSLAKDSEYGWSTGFFEPSWWYFQFAAIGFLLVCALVGGGVAWRKRWGLLGMRVMAPLSLTYLLAYDIFGGERAGWVSISALALTFVVGVSVWYVFRRGGEFAT